MAGATTIWKVSHGNPEIAEFTLKFSPFKGLPV
jgi:hypothetical protein